MKQLIHEFKPKQNENSNRFRKFFKALFLLKIDIIPSMLDHDNRAVISRRQFLEAIFVSPALASVLTACKGSGEVSQKPLTPTTDLDLLAIMPWGFIGTSELTKDEKANIMGMDTQQLRISGIQIFGGTWLAPNRLVTACENIGSDLVRCTSSLQKTNGQVLSRTDNFSFLNYNNQYLVLETRVKKDVFSQPPFIHPPGLTYKPKPLLPKTLSS